MSKIDLSVDRTGLKNAVDLVRKKGIIIPTFRQMVHPDEIADKHRETLRNTGLWEISPANLFRITWKNEPKSFGGEFGQVNYLEFPPSLTGVNVRIIGLVGKWFPTGAHKVGAAFGCLVPRLVTGQFDPTRQKAVWPSTGNYCRGGAYDSAILGCESIAILPEGMSKERFEWLSKVSGEVIKTPGSESNVKEIFDKCWELRKTGEDLMIFNQFDEFGNYLWHYHVTGHALEDVIHREAGPKDLFRGVCLTTGSAGTIACGDYLKQRFPGSKIIASEATQCPTLLENGFGTHRIEGIGDKHIPWIHNVKNTDMVVSIDDEAVVNIARLFNEPEGKDFLIQKGVPSDFVSSLDLLGFSGIANLLTCIKFSKYYELSGNDIVLTILTDSMELYGSRLEEMSSVHGEYTPFDASAHYARYLLGESTDNVLELTYQGRRRIHNLKYFTWVEQQGKSVEELNTQWYERDYWNSIQAMIPEIDQKIIQFNDLVLGGEPD